MGAACIYMQYCKRRLPDCQLTKWIDKQLAMRKPYGKIMVSLAAKLIRIAWAVLSYGEKFDIHRKISAWLGYNSPTRGQASLIKGLRAASGES